MARPPQTPLGARIAAAIAHSGPMGVDLFMAQALYDRELGYYVAGTPLGAAGDFTTAPEISQIFGELIGLWLAQSWLDLGAPSPCYLIELGPGRGSLMADIARVGARVEGFLAAMRIGLVETNQHLRAVQAAKLGHLKPIWFDQITDVPDGPALMIGNEFLDCMPIAQYVNTQACWREKQVGVDDAGNLIFGLGPPLPAPPAASQPEDEDGAVREQAPGLEAFVATIAGRFAKYQGRALFIDYGDLSGQAGDTLQALYRHKKTHPLDHVGQADLTAHVDFATLIHTATQQGLVPTGPISQRDFLLGLGAQDRARSLIAANPNCANDVLSALERLVGKEHMGALFNVVCLDSALNDGRGPPLGI